MKQTLKMRVRRARIKMVFAGVLSAGLVGLGFATWHNLAQGEELNWHQINQRQMVFLSDLAFDAERSHAAIGSVYRNKNHLNKKISLSINDEWRKFAKGLYAHAESVIEYDISKLRFDYLEGYFGIDFEVGASDGDGVIFEVETLLDGESNFKNVFTSPQAIKWNNPGYYKIDIRNAQKLKLIAKAGRDNRNDRAVYADIKLTKASYNGKNIDLNKISEYDNELLSTGSAQLAASNHQMSVLKRELVRRIGYDNLQELAAISDTHGKALTWLISNEKNLRDYLLNGYIEGSYERSLDWLGKILTKHQNDLSNQQLTKKGLLKSELYRKMMLAVALSHSQDVCFWVGERQCSDGVERYELFKDLHNQGLLSEVFEDLVVEEMRWVMATKIDNQQLRWLNYYAHKHPEGGLPYNIDPYRYIEYRFGYRYDNDKYYNPANQKKWNDKYRLADFNVRYGLEQGISGSQIKKPKLWMVFEEGAVCVGIAHTGANLNAALGIPSIVVTQPKHVAYLTYSKNNKKVSAQDRAGKWTIGNNIAGWGDSRSDGYLLAGWGENNRISDYKDDNASYVLLAQANLNHYQAYEQSRLIEMAADVFKTDASKLEAAYSQMITTNPLDYKAWQGLINISIKNRNKTEADFVSLAERVQDNFKAFPLPMIDMLKMLEPKIPSYKSFDLKKKGLNYGAQINVNDLQVSQPEATKSVARKLLGLAEEIVDFSFSGKNANKLVLAEKFKYSEVAYEYSLDGGRNWKMSRNAVHKLSETELSAINQDQGIWIYFVGATGPCDDSGCIGNDGKKRSPIHKIKITQHRQPDVLANDLENSIIGASDAMEWRTSGGWTSFSQQRPDLDGNVTIQVRMSSSGHQLSSSAVELKFTKNQSDDRKRYIALKHLQIEQVSSEEKTLTPKENIIDGDMRTFWHTQWRGGDNQRYVVIKIDKKVKLSALEYWPRQDNKLSGRIYKARILTSQDGVHYKDRQTVTFDQTAQPKLVIFTPAEPIQYIKIEGLETDNGSMSIAMLNLFEDVTSSPHNSGDNSGNQSGSNQGSSGPSSPSQPGGNGQSNNPNNQSKPEADSKPTPNLNQNHTNNDTSKKHHQAQTQTLKPGAKLSRKQSPAGQSQANRRHADSTLIGDADSDKLAKHKQESAADNSSETPMTPNGQSRDSDGQSEGVKPDSDSMLDQVTNPKDYQLPIWMFIAVSSFILISSIVIVVIKKL